VEIKLEQLIEDKEKYLINIHRVEQLSKYKERLFKIRQEYLDAVKQIETAVSEIFDNMKSDGVSHNQDVQTFVGDVISQQACPKCGRIEECLCINGIASGQPMDVIGNSTESSQFKESQYL
jgi:hypothetical protein